MKILTHPNKPVTKSTTQQELKIHQIKQNRERVKYPLETSINHQRKEVILDQFNHRQSEIDLQSVAHSASACDPHRGPPCLLSHQFLSQGRLPHLQQASEPKPKRDVDLERVGIKSHLEIAWGHSLSAPPSLGKLGPQSL